MQPATAPITAPRSSSNGLATVSSGATNGTPTTINANALAQLQAQSALAAMQYGAFGAASGANTLLTNAGVTVAPQTSIADYQQLLLK